MGKRTGIGWCHHTFNFWWGCVEVSPACDFCYAREMAKAFGHAVWGAGAPRRLFPDKHWDELGRWNREHERDGDRGRVFVMSMGDWGEERNDAVGEEMERCRQRFWALVPSLTSLEFLMLTKRPQAYRRLMPASIRALPNVWPGVTAERMDYRWRLEVLTAVEDFGGPLWVSNEPALDRLRIPEFLPNPLWSDLPSWKQPELAWWVIGGESGPRRRTLDLNAVSSAYQQTRTAGIALYVKQDSALKPGLQGGIPDDLWIHEFPR